jgi:hypothetical protein
MIVFHVVAIGLTVAIVVSGFERRYISSTRESTLLRWLWPAVPIGGLVPILLPLGLLAVGSVSRSATMRMVGWGIGQAEVIGGIIAAAYKAVTGRAHPTHSVDVDLTHNFRFGLVRGGIFWGWPSSRTTIAFAMTVTVFGLFPRPRWVGCLSIGQDVYIGLGYRTIHWFPDFASEGWWERPLASWSASGFPYWNRPFLTPQHVPQRLISAAHVHNRASLAGRVGDRRTQARLQYTIRQSLNLRPGVEQKALAHLWSQA